MARQSPEAKAPRDVERPGRAAPTAGASVPFLAQGESPEAKAPRDAERPARAARKAGASVPFLAQRESPEAKAPRHAEPPARRPRWRGARRAPGSAGAGACRSDRARGARVPRALAAAPRPARAAPTT